MVMVIIVLMIESEQTSVSSKCDWSLMLGMVNIMPRFFLLFISSKSFARRMDLIADSINLRADRVR